MEKSLKYMSIDEKRIKIILRRKWKTIQCNQKFFGQEHFEAGTSERVFCSNLSVLRPAMSQYGFAVRDKLPELPSDIVGLLQVKYNGMLSIVMWDEKRKSFVAWSLRGRCYYSLDDGRKHPVIEYFNERLVNSKNLAFVGETYVVRKISGKSYMTEFNKSMSIIKNPRSAKDVSRIRLAVFDIAKIKEDGGFERPEGKYINRFEKLQRDFMFPVGCDSGVVHLPDFLNVEDSFQDSHTKIQDFWNRFIGERRFEGLIMHTNNGEEYKIKFRDTLDVVIIAFRMIGNSRPMCEKCGARFDTFWLRKLVRDRVINRSQWFDQKGRLQKFHSEAGVWGKNTGSCPLCGGSLSNTAGPNLGAKIALMTSDSNFVDISDGVQFSPISPVLDLVNPLYEDEDYLWVKPEVVVEVSYQGDQLYIDRLRPVYRYEEGRYDKIGKIKAVSLRPYRPRLREDKTVNPTDLRLEQVRYFVDRIKSIHEKSQKAMPQEGLLKYLS